MSYVLACFHVNEGVGELWQQQTIEVCKVIPFSQTRNVMKKETSQRDSILPNKVCHEKETSQGGISKNT